MRSLLFWLSSCTLSLCTIVAPAGAGTTINITEADFDRWVYPFNGSPGFRQEAPVFGALGEGDFDDMDGQFLIGFNTATAGVPALEPGEKYKVLSVTVSATHSTGQFVYDPTFDPYASYLPGGDPAFVDDVDAGRPVEIYGAALRNDYTSFGFAGGETDPPTFNEGSFFTFTNPMLPGVRNAYAFDPDFGDVSNVISDRLLDAQPWAVGQVDGLAPGMAVPEGDPDVSAGATFEFAIDLTREEIHDYIAAGLEQGGLFFSVTSLHSTSQGGSSNPTFYSREHLDPVAIAPTLSIEFEIVPVPEPGTLAMGLLGSVALGLCCWRSRRRA